MIDNELASPVEQIGEGFFAARPFEHVALLDPLPRQIAAPLAKLVAQLCELFLLFQEFLPRFDPFPMRHNLMVLQHASLLARHVTLLHMAFGRVGQQDLGRSSVIAPNNEIVSKFQLTKLPPLDSDTGNPRARRLIDVRYSPESGHRTDTSS